MKKINFVRTDSHKKKKLGTKWRKPRGIQNKRRLRKRGYAPVVKQGYMTSNETRGKTKAGLELIMINSLSQIKEIDVNKQMVIISGKLGNKKRIEILQEVKKANIKVQNLNVDKKITSIKKGLEKNKELKETKLKAKEKKKVEAKKSVEDKVKSEEDKKTDSKDSETKEIDESDKDKKDFDKLLTKKQ